MAEMYVNVYFQHQDAETQKKLVRLFESDPSRDDAAHEAFVSLATEINPEKGEGIAKAFLRDVDEKIHEMFGCEDVTDIAGYCCASSTYGGGGDRFAARSVKFLYHLCPGIQALAWGMGDDDPWEFWFKHEDGRLIRHDAEPFDGYDARIRSTIYRWWHEGLPDEIREGMLNDSDYEDDDDSEPVTEEQYQEWLKGNEGGSDLEDDVEEVVMDELVGALTGALGSLFAGGSKRPAVSANAIDATSIDEDLVRRVFDDMHECEKAFDVDGILKHISKSLKGSITTTIDGSESTLPLTHSLYRMSLKLVLKEDADYESEQVIEDISIGDDSAKVQMTGAITFVDPTTNTRMHSTTADEYVLEIVEGKVQITGLTSKELSSKAA